jgi:hypothetical protein
MSIGNIYYIFSNFNFNPINNKVNKKLKIFGGMSLIFSFSFISINNYRLFYSKKEINLNDMIFRFNQIENNHNKKKENSKKEINSLKDKKNNNITKYITPFESIKCKSLEKNSDEIMLKNLQISLYNTPLTNKLFPKSNLYGHELIRYFDF